MSIHLYVDETIVKEDEAKFRRGTDMKGEEEEASVEMVYLTF